MLLDLVLRSHGMEECIRFCWDLFGDLCFCYVQIKVQLLTNKKINDFFRDLEWIDILTLSNTSVQESASKMLWDLFSLFSRKGFLFFWPAVEILFSRNGLPSFVPFILFKNLKEMILSNVSLLPSEKFGSKKIFGIWSRSAMLNLKSDFPFASNLSILFLTCLAWRSVIDCLYVMKSFL